MYDVLDLAEARATRLEHGRVADDKGSWELSSMIDITYATRSCTPASCCALSLRKEILVAICALVAYDPANSRGLGIDRDEIRGDAISAKFMGVLCTRRGNFRREEATGKR